MQQCPLSSLYACINKVSTSQGGTTYVCVKLGQMSKYTAGATRAAGGQGDPCAVATLQNLQFACDQSSRATADEELVCPERAITAWEMPALAQLLTLMMHGMRGLGS